MLLLSPCGPNKTIFREEQQRLCTESDLDNNIAETMPNQINQSIYLHGFGNHGFGNHGFSLPQRIWIFSA